MKLSEMYAVTSLSIDTWHEDYSDAVTDIMQVDDVDSVKDQFSEDASSRLLVHEKFYYTSDGYRGVTGKVLTFDDVPFAAHFTGGRSGRDAKAQYITDLEVWAAARGYLVAEITNALAKEIEVTDADQNLMDGFYDVKFAKHGDNLVAVDRSFASNEGLLLLDVHAFNREYQKSDLSQRMRWASADEAMPKDVEERLVQTLRDAVIGERLDLDLAYSSKQSVYAVSKTGNQTIVHTFNPTGRNFLNGACIGCYPVGPASMFECYIRLMGNKPLTADMPYIQEVAKAFDIDAETVLKAASDFLADGGKQVPERLMEIGERDQRVPMELDDKYGTYALAFRLHDNPGLLHFSPGVGSNWAKGMVDMIEKHFSVDASSPKI
jgi:hypothetical protein